MNEAKEQVVLVDKAGRTVGTCGKLAAHREALLHRAFSVFLFDAAGRCLLQRRHEDKYHSGGLWSNACCSHPRPGEDTAPAARRRLYEEMGVSCKVYEAFSFIYRHRFDSGLVEYEFDHVFVGEFEGTPRPNPVEVEGWRWIGLPELEAEIAARPEAFSYWMRACLPKVAEVRQGLAAFEADVPHFERLAV